MPLGQITSVGIPRMLPPSSTSTDEGIDFTDLIGILDEEHPKRKPKAPTFALPLEDKQLVIDMAYTWMSAYKGKRRYPQVQRDWKRVEHLLEGLE